MIPTLAPRAGALLLAAAPLFAQSDALPVQFYDAAPFAGVDVACFGRGSAIVDLDGDGLLDLVATSASQRSYYFRQISATGPHGAPQFQEMTAAWQIPQDAKQTWGVVAADFDNDGDKDLYFPCGGFHYAESDRFLRNDLPSSGRFTRLTAAEAGDLLALRESGFGASAVDYDRDGDLDLFVSATTLWGESALQSCRLLRNDGALHFTDVSRSAGIVQLGNYKHTGVGDYDNDGWPDLGAGQMGGPARLWRNLGDGSFDEVAQAAGLAGPDKNFGFVFEDFDNDGWLDVYLPQYLHVCCTGISRLYLSNRDGSFRDVSVASGIGRHEDMGHNTGDLNADGYPDLYIGAGHPATTSYDVLYMLRPNGAAGLDAYDLSRYSRIRTAGAGRNHGTPFGDVNNDGFVDVWAVNGGPSVQPGTIQEAYLWLSAGNANRWLKVELRGVRSNRDAVGARLSVRTEEGREVRRAINAGRGFTNTDAHVAHFGLGRATRADWLQVRWPSGLEQTQLAPPIGGIAILVETGIWTEGVAQTGRELTIEACGVPGDEVRLLVSAGTDEQLVPEWGGFLRVSSPWVELPPAVVGATGFLKIGFPVPNDPGRVGRPLYFQARVIAPDGSRASMTNRLDLIVE